MNSQSINRSGIWLRLWSPAGSSADRRGQSADIEPGFPASRAFDVALPQRRASFSSFVSSVHYLTPLGARSLPRLLPTAPRFAVATDSPAEQAGFEPSVPRDRDD